MADPIFSVGQRIIWQYELITTDYFKIEKREDGGTVVGLVPPGDNPYRFKRQWQVPENWKGGVDLSAIIKKEFFDEWLYIIISSTSQWLTCKSACDIKPYLE